MSSFALRLLALSCMCVDHAGLALFPSVGLFRCIGRAAFPLYCFLLTQGYIHTRDLRAYGRRLLLLAFVSEIPFDLLIFGRLTSGMEQNVLFSLFFGLLALYAIDTLKKKPHTACLSLLILALAAMLCRVSFGWLSIALCLSFYYAAERRMRLVLFCGGSLLLYSFTLLFSGVARSWVLVSFCSLFSLLPILLYNGERGPRCRAFTFLFYASYPLHLAALVALRAMHLVPPHLLS